MRHGCSHRPRRDDRSGGRAYHGIRNCSSVRRRVLNFAFRSPNGGPSGACRAAGTIIRASKCSRGVRVTRVAPGLDCCGGVNQSRPKATRVTRALREHARRRHGFFSGVENAKRQPPHLGKWNAFLTDTVPEATAGGGGERTQDGGATARDVVHPHKNLPELVTSVFSFRPRVRL